MSDADQTTDPALRSWLPVAPGSDFPIQNLPYGVFARGQEPSRTGVALGEHVVDLGELARAGLFDSALDDAVAVLGAGSLDPLLRRDRTVWRGLRRRLSALLAAGNTEIGDAGIRTRAIVPMREVSLRLPFAAGDYVDFYSSREHATNLGKILRPDTEPLLPNWRWIPIGYHGRSGTIVSSGTPVVRPNGQRKAPDATEPTFGPTRMLDFELELGFVTGGGPRLGTPLRVESARDAIFGMVIVNDWSARDIQGWEYQPLGPFLGKSFATSISTWVVPLEALEPFRTPGPPQDPPPLPYLAVAEPRNYDIGLAVRLRTAKMRSAKQAAQTIARTNARGLYWSCEQQLAHLASNGASVRPGDLFATGTISGDAPGTYGSMIELTWRGARPIAMESGEIRAFLEDGDEVEMSASCDREGAAHIGFGTVTGTIVAATNACA